jgi:hypothetical protein
MGLTRARDKIQPAFTSIIIKSLEYQFRKQFLSVTVRSEWLDHLGPKLEESLTFKVLYTLDLEETEL